MAEYLATLQELKNLPSGLHWFCNAYNSSLATQDVLEIKSEHSNGESVNLRRNQATQCLRLFAFEGPDAAQYQEDLAKGIDRQLERCDLCVVEYYKSKHNLIQDLRHEGYEDDDVNQLMKIFSQRDIERITLGLDGATCQLRGVDPSRLHKNTLTLPAQLALFEALNCEAFLADETLLEQHFQEPFTLVQTNKKLRILQYVPAATFFLFDDNHHRRMWATHTWSGYRNSPSKDDFNFAIHDQLLQTMQRTFEVVSDLTFLQRFWYGMGLVVNKLDNNLVTHSLRAMEIDVFKLALDHLKYDTEGFRFLLQTIRRLLELAPKDFWDSMGAISPTTFIEQIFNNPQFDKVTKHAQEDEDYECSALKDMLSWIKPFMASLETVHQARACRSLSFQLLDRLQADRFPVYARVECYRIGLATLAWTLGNCNKEGATLSVTGRVVTAETLEVVSDYTEGILRIPSLHADDQYHEPCAEFCVRIIKVSLALECKSLRTDQDALKQSKELPNGYNSYSLAIWDAIVKNLDRGNVAIARASLVGINDLTGLEKFKINVNETYSREKSAFNVKLGRLSHLVCQILERINDFDPDDLDKLFRSSDTATALVASLLSPDASLYEAGVNLIKSISFESARKEAIGHLMRTFFDTTLNAYSWSIRRIARNRTFASCPRMLKTSSDMLDILCDVQNGLLRTYPLAGLPDTKAVENFWEHQWEGLRVIYEMTEEWGKAKAADSTVLKEFCRDTMQFSERFFDQYSVFAHAMNYASTVKEEEGIEKIKGSSVGKELLQHPAKIMAAMVKWLRLRDLFLIDISVKLTNKVLDRLTNVGMDIAQGPCSFLELVLGNRRGGQTYLTLQQKTELARHLEANLGRSVSVVDTDQEPSATPSDVSGDQSAAVKKTKAGVINLDAWRSKAKASGQVVEVSDEDEFDDAGILDLELLSASRSVESTKQRLTSGSPLGKPAAARARQSLMFSSLEQKMGKSVTTDAKSDSDRVSFREKREREREAKKRRDAETLALVKKKAVTGLAGQTLGESSTLGNIGVKGKDHAPKASGLMVSSGSESESEDDLDHELFGRAPKPVMVSSAVREYQAIKSMQAKVKGPVKKARQVRSAKDMRARLAPDLTALHKTILGWDFFHNGDFPPGSERENYSLVTSTFRTPMDYQNTFEPLLLLEAWQGFLKSKEEGNFRTFEIRVANRMNVDLFLEVSTIISMAEGKDLGISEADIVLISKDQSPPAAAQQPHCLARVFKISRKKATMEITYRANVGNGLVSCMVPNSTLYGVKISSITPLEREYGALLGLKYFDLCDEVIRARASPLLDYSEAQLASLVSNYNINVAQAKAVRSAIDNDAFTLIQGPPGSGKTKTIVAIVGALLTGSFGDRGVPIARPKVDNENNQRLENRPVSKKLLVCAPSNAAVDELVMRFKEGVKTFDGNAQKLSVIRLGRSDAINANVLDVTLEELVNAKLNIGSGKKTSSGEDIHILMLAHKAASEKFSILRARMDETKSSGKPVSPEQARDFELLKRRRQQLSNQIDTARDSGDAIARDAELSRRRVQQEILDGAHVICATLSGSGHEMFQGLNIEFEDVIIDEAAQSIELSALIPLKYGCSKCILVGDPKQLPPTVLSREAARFQYEQSLFVRMQANRPNDVHLLDTQYRMHPEISMFPSNAFYDSRLLDGPGMAKLRTRPWHQSKILGPYRFFDVQGTHQNAPRGHSLVNLAEIDIALNLFDRLIKDCRGYDFAGKIGIITPYRSQLRELRSRFAQRHGDSIFTTVEFNTTDAFQGRESEVIIFSCVRASSSGGIGFLSDIRRMNVGITRAKSSLWVLGNSQSLMRGEFWGRLIQDARSRDRYTAGDLTALLRNPLLQPGPKTDLISNASPLPGVSPVSDYDIDMPDAPIVSSVVKISGHSSAVAESFGEGEMLEENSAVSYHPAGGANGLNTNANCQVCGSFTHFTNHCDNTDALNSTANRCYRCGKVGHVKAFCSAEKCLICGEIGHLQKTCSSSNPLPSKQKERLGRAEADHKILLQRAPEFQRKKQLGDHDMQVPVVRSTSSTGSMEHGSKALARRAEPTGEKRKRANSPPIKVSEGSKFTAEYPRHLERKAKKPMTQEQQPLPELPSRNLTGRHDQPSTKPAAHPPSSKPTASTIYNGAAVSEKARKTRVLLDRRSESYDAGHGTMKDAGLPSRPFNGSDQRFSTTGTANSGPIGKPPLPIVRPPKQKKDADPFIRPKKKR